MFPPFRGTIAHGWCRRVAGGPNVRDRRQLPGKGTTMAVSKFSRFTDRILAAMRRGRMAGAIAAALSAGATAAWAQEPAADAGVNRTFLNKSNIDLPIEIENSYRSQISKLVL